MLTESHNVIQSVMHVILMTLRNLYFVISVNWKLRGTISRIFCVNRHWRFAIDTITTTESRTSTVMYGSKHC